MSPPSKFGDGLGRAHPAWVVEAACRRLSPAELAIFHPEHKDSPRAAAQRAKRVCAPCPVRVRCRDFGDQVSPDFGIFGGLTATERRTRRTNQERGAA